MKIERRFAVVGVALISVMIAGAAIVSMDLSSTPSPTGRAPDQQGGESGAPEPGHREDGHDGEDQAASEISLTAAQIELAGIETEPARRGEINIKLALTGEVTVNQDRLAHVVSPVSGVVREVRSNLGDHPRAGDVMVVVESRELADLKATYMAARERLALAKAKYVREERLWKTKISSEQEYLDARQAHAEARIELRSAEQKLHALGYSEADLGSLADNPDKSIAKYEIAAPFSGTVIEKHVTLGEQVGNDTDLFSLSDLDTVWVIGNVYEKDIARVETGQAARIFVKSHPGRSFGGQVTWVAASLDEKTRTLKIRIEVDNADRFLKPGMFARLMLAVGGKTGVLTVSPAALQRQRGETIVFVEKGGGRFERREVKPGIRTATAVEITDGIREGEAVVTSGSFILKSELEKTAFGGGHGH